MLLSVSTMMNNAFSESFRHMYLMYTTISHINSFYQLHKLHALKKYNSFMCTCCTTQNTKHELNSLTWSHLASDMSEIPAQAGKKKEVSQTKRYNYCI